MPRETIRYDADTIWIRCGYGATRYDTLVRDGDDSPPPDRVRETIKLSDYNKSRVRTMWFVNLLGATLERDFTFTSFQVNFGFDSIMHNHRNTLGPSYVVAFGKFTGGELWIYDADEAMLHATWGTRALGESARAS